MHRRFWFVAGWAATTGCIVASRGTDETTFPDARDGQVEVSWRVGTSSCEEAGIVTVEIQVGLEAASFPCTDQAGTLSVPAGVYGLQLIGYDAEQLPRYGADAEDVSVFDGQLTTVPTLVLSSLPATVSATWYFDNGRLCGYNGVSTVDLSLFDLDDTLKGEVEAPCEDGAAYLGEVEAGDYILLAYGRNDQGTATHRGEVATTLTRGDAAVLDLELLPEAQP
jgi:hypothetical protein